MRMLLIRHGQTPNNVAGALDTAFPGAGLTPLGQAQAQAVRAALAEEQVAGVYASRLVRTQLTAQPLAEARGLDVTVQPGLEEISAGDFELRTDDEAVDAYLACVSAWMRGDLGHRLPGGTDGHAFRARFDAAVRAIADRHEADATVAVFSHGAAIRVYSALAAGLLPEVAEELWIMNTGLALLEGGPDRGWQLVRWSSEPLGGQQLGDELAHDVTGERATDAVPGH